MRPFLHIVSKMPPTERFRIELILGSSDSADLILYFCYGANISKHSTSFCGVFYAADVISFMKIHVFEPLGGVKKFSRNNVFCSIYIKEQYGVPKKMIYRTRILTLTGCDILLFLPNF